ncbi:MAG: hypothetical protein ACM3JI_03230 [Anaerolineae bacterium]
MPKNPAIHKRNYRLFLNCFEKICEQLKKLALRAEKLARENEDVKRLMTIPGVRAITALSYKIEIGDPK